MGAIPFFTASPVRLAGQNYSVPHDDLRATVNIRNALGEVRMMCSAAQGRFTVIVPFSTEPHAFFR